MKTRRILLVGCILALGLILVAPAFAQQETPVCTRVVFFPETGHNVCDQFLDFFQSRGGVGIFGFPITEQFEENGRLVQYFQRVRMEHHPELSPTYKVQLGLLGDLFAPLERKDPIRASVKPKSNDRERRYFPETGHTVQFDFLEFFDKKGGIDVFGYPVTEFFTENDRVKQYFQRALMEWDPNHRDNVVLHNLGETWVDQHPQLRRLRGSALQLAPSGEKVPPVNTVTTLSATASVRDTVLGREDDQTVWVYVTDQNGEPVDGAQVTLVAPSLSNSLVVPMPPTDQYGHTRIAFDLDGLDIDEGQFVILEARVVHQGQAAKARTNFLVWR